jgi:hypothetical protein
MEYYENAVIYHGHNDWVVDWDHSEENATLQRLGFAPLTA